MKKTGRRVAKIPSTENLKNVALHYLGRYAASEAALRRVLHNRLRRAQIVHPSFAADQQKQTELRDVIETIIAIHKRTGVINDAAFADMKVASMRRSGKSERFIQQKLAQRGVAKNHIAQALATHDQEAGEEAELQAATALCRKRRLGPFRPKERQKEGDERKDFSILARAGFGSNIIRQILKSSFEPEEEAFSFLDR